MNIIEAMRELEKGKKVRKVKWDPICYIAYNKTNNTFVDENSNVAFVSTYLNSDKWELYKEHILTEKEKKYLSNVIRPFKERVISITKETSNSGDYYYIAIRYKSIDSEMDFEDTLLSLFPKKADKYRNIEANCPYKLEELGL